MTDIYEHLARSLDKLPNGFPSTESGVELKILQKIFTPQEAGGMWDVHKFISFSKAILLTI